MTRPRRDIYKISTATLLMLGGFLLCQKNDVKAELPPSQTLSGITGLNSMPSARMHPAGTIFLGAGTLEPFLHAYAGMQIAQPLEIVLRQSAQISSLSADADSLNPGVDLKLRLLEENERIPAIAAGMHSALGDNSMRVPYLTFSKRYNDFDFTLGKGWERYDKNFGIFGGVEYTLPIKGISVKADYTPQSYKHNKRERDFHAPSPLGIGINYTHDSGVSASFGIQGTDKILATLSYSFKPEEWTLYKNHSPADDFYKQRPQKTDDKNIPKQAENQGINLSIADFKGSEAHANLTLNDTMPTPLQIGRTARIIAQNSPQEIEEITITPKHRGFDGTSITIQRKDLENSYSSHAMSPQELWHNTKFSRHAHAKHPAKNKKFPLTVRLEQNIDFSSHQRGLFHKNALIAETQSNILNSGFINHIGLRINMLDNIDETYGNMIAENPAPVRSDIGLFAKRKFALDTAFISYAHSFTPDFSALASAGYMDEQYAGIGAQILYRPFRSRFALGAQVWHAIKRSPYTFMNAGTVDQTGKVALAEAWYDLPAYDVTLHTQAGHFLGGDNGAIFGLEKTFKNGATLSGSIAISDKKEIDVTGNETRTVQKLNLKIPLGGFKFIPDGSSADFNAGSFGDDIAQNIHTPIDLFEATTLLGIKNLSENWITVTE